MTRSRALVYVLTLGIGTCSIFMFTGLVLGQPCEPWAAKIVSVQGAVQARKAGEAVWIQVRLDQSFCPGDIIRVLKNSRAAISLSNDTLIRIDQNTTISITGFDKERTFFLELVRGVVHFFSRFPRRLKIATPFVNAAVEGTEFYVRVDADQTSLSIFEGRVALANAAGSLAVAAGQSAVAIAGKAPVLYTVVKPRDAVQWALYYPPIIDWRPIDFSGGKETQWQQMVRKSIAYYWQGNLVGAFSILEKAPEDIRDPRFFLYRAALFLTVGRVEAAQTDITTALSLDPSNSYAVALQSIIAVVQNDKDRALELANRAVELAPQSSTAMVALSYARQSHFDIQGALESLRKAVELGPENALAWSRLSELYLSVGELTKAGRAANKAVTLNPNLARTQTVLGFTLIDRIKIKAAKQTFEKAIELDSAAPLPRLGLGLAKIRGGDLDEGRAEIEIAACLDPNSSLIRSYLGKAYYEEKRDKLAEDQYAIAKKLDPLDPTPWFYDAIRKQTINRPVEALQDMQKSIELNDNRGVYRSRLLLDEDLAARSANLGRIYNNLGFQQLGLVEGWKSVGTAPDNYSAHRLLADLYASVPRHEIARVSELLQAQLLQPININPVPPQLGVSRLLIAEGAGPAEPAFNEFNPLFNRNRLTLQAGALGGDENTVGDEITQSGLLNDFSYSLGQFHYQTDGFRTNNDLKENILDAFVQASLTPSASVQAEVRRQKTNHGDLELSFNPANPDESFRRKARESTARLGFHFAPAVHSDIIASVIFQDAKEDQSFDFFGFPFDWRLETDGYIGETQYQFRNTLFSFIAGGGHYKLNSTLKQSFLGNDDKEHFDTTQNNGYLYSQIGYPAKVTWTLGASYDSLDDDKNGDFNKFNPKLGMIWDITPATTLRLAAFKVLKRTLIADQTIEPTQVAGFNQFFDDINGTESKRYGAAVDQILFPNLFGGLEVSRRDLKVPIAEATGGVIKEDWHENFFRAYLNWTFLREFAFSSEYQYEYFDRNVEDEFGETPRKMKTHILPGTLGYFHPSGFFSRVRATYVNQWVKLSTGEKDDDQFVVVDLSAGYRLPARFGIVNLTVTNIFDKKFRYQGIDSRTSQYDTPPSFLPDRSVFFGVTLSF